MPGGTFASDALFYWIRTTVSHPLHGMYVNTHPYSCTLEQTLCESDNGTTCLGRQTLSDLYITFEAPTVDNAHRVPASIPVIKVEKSVNKKLKYGQEVKMMY